MLLLLALIGCASVSPSDKYEGIFSSEEELDWDIEHEDETYAVVVASTAPSSVYDAAKKLASKLAENTGAYAECFYAHEDMPSGKGVCRILVGNTGIEESTKYLKNFRVDDIGYKYHDSCVCIGGITEESLLLSIEKFVSDVVVYADKEFFMNDGTDVFVAGEYEISEIKLTNLSSE